MKKITPFLLGLGLTLIMVGGFLSSSPKDVGAATVVSLGKNGTSEYLLYPTDTLSAYTFIATSTTASSSFANGINLTGGCFAIGSVCLPTLSANNTWTGAQTFGTITASTGTIDHLVTDELTAKTSGGSTFRSANGTPVSVLGVGNSANVLFYGGVNIDGAVRMATSLNGLALLTNGAVTSIATSSLGLLTTDVAEGSNLYFTNGRVLTYLDTLSKGYFFSTTSADAWDSTKSRWSTTSNTYWLTQQTTDGLAQGSTNKYFANSLVDTWLGTKNLGVFWSTTSADAWHLTKTDVAFSTTSADYWISLYPKGFFFSTTSADYWLTTKGISAASSTLYGDNGTFSGSNQFASLNWTNATGSRATTTSLAVTSVTSALHLANATGGIGAYGGTSCTNQFVRSLSALGAATCATVGAADVSLANLTATNGTLTFSGTYNGATARTIGLNLANANTWTGGQIFGNSTTTSATTTKLFATTASTSALYLSTGTCSGSSALTVTNGLVGCGAISSGSASSTLLGDNNLFSGNNIFNSITRSTSTQATSTNFFSTYVVGTNGTITNLLATNSTTTNATTTTIYNSGTASTTSLYVNGNPILGRWKDGVEASSPTTTDEYYKLGNCLEPSGRAVKIDKVAALIASTTVGTPNQGITFNINIASSFSATPSSMFTSDQNVNSTSTQKSITTGFSNNVIPAGYCWWYDINGASTTQIGGWNLNLYGYEQ